MRISYTSVFILFALAMLPQVVYAWTPPVPDNAQQFTCYEFGLPDNNTWTSPDQCYSYALGADPFFAGIPAGKVAYVTDYIVTPTTESTGSYYTGVRQASSGGSGFNPQLYYRSSSDESLNINNTAPMLTITAGNELQFYNSSSSPGTVRILIQGYIADIPTDSHPFSCYEFGLPDDSTWTFPDQCFSWTLGADPFSGGLLNDHKAVITDLDFTPTTSAVGGYYYGAAQSTTGGSNFNPQIFMRGNDDRSVSTNQTAPILVITEGNTIRFFNSTTSAGSMRARLYGYIVSDDTFYDGTE